MLNHLKNLIKLYKLSKKSKVFQEILEHLDDEDIRAIPEEETKAVFLSDMTDDEYNDYVRSEVKGWKVVDDKIRKILYGRK